MLFKKYYQYLIEGKKPKSHEIRETEVPQPKVDPNTALKCPKCGSSEFPCDCFSNDYYDAKLPQQTPRPNKIVKNKDGKIFTKN
jgi:hypothetical protein